MKNEREQNEPQEPKEPEAQVEDLDVPDEESEDVKGGAVASYFLKVDLK
jgi:hypothetical protein